MPRKAGTTTKRAAKKTVRKAVKKVVRKAKRAARAVSRLTLAQNLVSKLQAPITEANQAFTKQGLRLTQSLQKDLTKALVKQKKADKKHQQAIARLNTATPRGTPTAKKALQKAITNTTALQSDVDSIRSALHHAEDALKKHTASTKALAQLHKEWKAPVAVAKPKKAKAKPAKKAGKRSMSDNNNQNVVEQETADIF